MERIKWYVGIEDVGYPNGEPLPVRYGPFRDEGMAWNFARDLPAHERAKPHGEFWQGRIETMTVIRVVETHTSVPPGFWDDCSWPECLDPNAAHNRRKPRDV